MCLSDSKCQLNFYELPSKKAGVCTHHSNWNTDQIKVYNCKSRKYENCELVTWCKANFYKEPSGENNVCTH